MGCARFDVFLVAGALLGACAGDGDDAPTSTERVDASAPAPTASLRVLSYNVAGLPEGLSASMPARNSPLISPLLNDYDLVLLQEDFSYRAQIASMVRLPHASPPDLRGESLGDGLSVFSNLALRDFDRIRWSMCFGMFDSGSDCLTPKGFASMRVEVTPDLAIDVYDLHADAGDGPSDAAARASNLAQVAAAVLVRSAGRAVIVAGDFNTRHTRDGSLQTLRDATGLRDVWVDLMRGGQAPPVGTPLPCTSDPNDVACERIDKILYRSSDTVRLVPLAYTVEGARFVDAQGAPLSDHRPVAAHFELRRAD